MWYNSLVQKLNKTGILMDMSNHFTHGKHCRSNRCNKIQCFFDKAAQITSATLCYSEPNKVGRCRWVFNGQCVEKEKTA